MEAVPIIALSAFAAGLIVALIVVVTRRSGPAQSQDIAVPLQNLTQATNALQIELTKVSERVAGIEQIKTDVTQAGAVTKGIVDSAAAIRQELSQAKTSLTELQAQAKARASREEDAARSIKRLEQIIAGTQSKGSAGENILEGVLAQFPAEWQKRDFKVGNKSVEFGLVLPNNLVLPIDSKWPATDLLEKFLACEDEDEKLKLRKQIETAVLNKAREVKKYVDPNVTVNFGVAAVPDAVYELCSAIRVDVFKENVVLVSYSMFVPYLLLVFQTILKTSQNIDLQKLDAYLESAQKNLDAVQEELDGALSRGIKMVENSRDKMRQHLSKASGSLTSIEIGAGPAAETPRLTGRDGE